MSRKEIAECSAVFASAGCSAIGSLIRSGMLFLVLAFTACTDYEAMIDDDYDEWIAYNGTVQAEGSSSSTPATPSSSSTPIEDLSSGSSGITYGTLTDSRDGQTYKTVTIGTQTWMAENLNYETANSWCYDDDAGNCATYGRIYTWAAAMDSAGTWSTKGEGCGYGSTCSPTYPVRGVCPSGWHLPTKAEFETLFTAVGGQSTAGQKLKSQTGWNNSGNGTDACGFSALPAGYRYSGGSFYYQGNYAAFWSSAGGFATRSGFAEAVTRNVPLRTPTPVSPNANRLPNGNVSVPSEAKVNEASPPFRNKASFETNAGVASLIVCRSHLPTAMSAANEVALASATAHASALIIIGFIFIVSFLLVVRFFINGREDQ